MEQKINSTILKCSIYKNKQIFKNPIKLKKLNQCSKDTMLGI